MIKVERQEMSRKNPRISLVGADLQNTVFDLKLENIPMFTDNSRRSSTEIDSV